jgi:AraC-like DNA-binding protein
MARVSVSLLNLVCLTASKKGVDRAHLLSKVGISEEILKDSENYVSCELLGRITQIATELTKDPNFPLENGLNFQPSNLNILGYLVSNSPDLRSAYEQGARFDRIVGDGVKFSYEITDDFVYNYLDVLDPELEPFAKYTSESCLSQMVTLKRQMVGKNIDPVAVYFKHSRRQGADAYERIFRCKIYFNAERNSVVFPVSVLDEKIVHANPDLFVMFKKYAEEYLGNLNHEKDWTLKVTKILFDLIQKNSATLEQVAQKLYVGSRTLQRQLKAEGTSFNNVLKDVRSEIAKQHLQNTSISISEISYLLGFSEPSIFHRSFKKWTGKTPRLFRMESALA